MLEKLYYGLISPWEQEVKLSEGQIKIAEETDQLHEYLFTRLMEADGEKLDELIRLTREYFYPNECSAFIYGFKICFDLLKELNFKMDDLVADSGSINNTALIAAVTAKYL